MNILFWVILGWFIGEVFQLTIWEWWKEKYNLDMSKIKSFFIFLFIGLIVTVVGSGFYTVSTEENIILTTISGRRLVREDVGIKYNFLSSREPVSLQKQVMQFPMDFYYTDGYEIITSDEKPLLVHSFLEYRIKDVYKWGIENKDAQQKLQISFASNVKKTIQKRDYESIRFNIDLLEQEIKEEMLQFQDIYGIEVINVNLQVSDSVSIRRTKSEAEMQKITSEALKQSYLSESEALQIKYESLDDKEFIKFMEFLKAIREGDIDMIVMPQDIVPSLEVR